MIFLAKFILKYQMNSTDDIALFLLISSYLKNLSYTKKFAYDKNANFVFLSYAKFGDRVKEAGTPGFIPQSMARWVMPTKTIHFVDANHPWPLFSDSLVEARQCDARGEATKKLDMFSPHGAHSLVNKQMATSRMGEGRKSDDKTARSTLEPTEGALKSMWP